MLNRIRRFGQSFISNISWWLFAPPWDQRRQKFNRSFIPRLWNVLALIGGLAIGGLIMWDLLSSGESVAISVIIGLLSGFFTFVLYYFAGKLFNKYIIPVLFASMGVDHYGSEPLPWKGTHRKRAWVIYAVLIVLFIWVTFISWESWLGAWGWAWAVLATLVWLGFIIGLFRFIRIRNRRLTSKKHGQETENHTEMREHNGVADYLNSVTQHLRTDGFKITENVTYKNQTFKYVAKRTRWQLEYYGFAEFFFVFAEFSGVDRASLREFSTVALNYSKKFRSIPLPRGFSEAVICFPVAIVDNVDQAVVETVQSEASPKHWAAFEMPVIYDLKSKRLYYLEKTPYWGSLYWDHFRDMLRTILSP